MRRKNKLFRTAFSVTGLSCLTLLLCAPLFTEKAKSAPPPSCPFVVDPGGGGTHTTIQAAVDDLPNPGPCSITVKPGTYAEQVNIGDQNRAATMESQRITIVADPSAPPGSVIIDPPGTSGTGFVVNHSKFITVKGFEITGGEKGITMAGGSNSSDDVVLEANLIHNIGSAGASGTAGIAIGSGNANTTVVNNLIRDVGRSGITVDSPNSSPIYIVNNTIVQNMWNGVTRAVSANVFLINNLIANNGSAVGGSGNCRTGLCQSGNGTAVTVTLINNMFYNNAVADLSTPAQQLDGTDSGNRTTTGAEGTGVVGCTFADCTNTHLLTEIFVSPAINDYHLKTAAPISPAVDRGVDTFVDGGQERVPITDFEGDVRPKDGDNSGTATTDIGYDEATAPSLAKMETFNARRTEGGWIRLEWQTGYEVDNLGFNIYREQAGKRIRVTPQMIAGSALVTGPGTALTAGKSYSWWDNSIGGSKDVRYWLEEVDLAGQSSWHGPIAIDDSSPPDRLAPPVRSRLLSAVGADSQSDTSSSPVERRAIPPRMPARALELQSAPTASSAMKLWVKREGWYRVTQPELVAAGLNATVNPQFLQLFVDGKEQPLMVSGEKDGSFDPSDQIEFYGIGLDSPFTDTRTYRLLAGSQPGRRMNIADGRGRKAAPASFPFTVERKDRTVYFSGLRNGETENFFGAVIAKAAVDQSLVLRHLDPSAAEATLEIALQGVSVVPHRVTVKVNGTGVGEVAFAEQEQGAGKFTLRQSLLKEGDNKITLTAQGADSDISLVDSIRLTYWHTYTADRNALRFTASTKRQVTIDGFSSAAIRVMDVTEPDAVREVAAEVKAQGSGYGVTVAVPKPGERTLLAFAEDQIMRPEAMAADRPSTLRDKNSGADLLIITNRDLASSVETLKALRLSQGLTVMVADIEDVYDEFSYGEKTPYALKDFLLYAHSQWKQSPRYVLMVGDASFDPKNYLGNGDFDLVPTELIDTQFMETASDDWLVDFGGTGLPEMAVGRLPVRTVQEANTMISKIIGYDTSGGSASLLLASDINDGFDFVTASARLRTLVPSSVQVEEVRRDSLDGPTAKSQLLASINRGQKIVNYTGHGSVDQWKGNLLTSADAKALANNQNPSMFVMMTCLNGYFQDPLLDSLAEALMKVERGGAVGVWASSGQTKPDQQVVLNQQLFRLLFDETGLRRLTLGEATVSAKAAVTDGDVRRTWILFGDPTMRLK